jgi:hypothetical protein
MWICDRNLYRTQEGFLVEEGDPRAVELVHRKGVVLASEPKVFPAGEPQTNLTPPHPPAPFPKRRRGDKKALRQAKNKAVKPEEDK